jgi:hypothetical protein
MKHYGYPSIPQFREVVYQVKSNYEYIGKNEKGEPMYDASMDKPKLTFHGTPKIHGANTSIVLLKDETLQFQSMEMILDDHKDIYNFYHTFQPISEELKSWIQAHQIFFEDHIAIYGEWCGMGIQKKTAINQLDKLFVIFGLRVDDKWLDVDKIMPFNRHRIYHIDQFPSYTIEIDFNNPSLALEELNTLTTAIDQECPVAKHFGISGTGEGIVWEAVVIRQVYDGDMVTFNYRFKTKGETHKIKETTNEVDPLISEMYKSCDDFVKANLSENRLAQGISKIEATGQKVVVENIVEFLRWCVADIKKECYLEIEANNLDEKILNKTISKQAREYFLNYLNNNI